MLNLLEKAATTAQGGCRVVDTKKIKSKSHQKTGMLSYLSWGYLGTSGTSFLTLVSRDHRWKVLCCICMHGLGCWVRVMLVRSGWPSFDVSFPFPYAITVDENDPEVDNRVTYLHLKAVILRTMERYERTVRSLLDNYSTHITLHRVPIFFSPTRTCYF